MSTENRKSSRTRLGGSNLETTAVDQETLDRNAEVIEAVLTASQETELLGILQEINFGNDQVDKLGHLLTPAKSKLVTVQFQDLTSKLTLGLVTVMAYIRGGTSSYKYCRKMCWGSAHNHTATNWQRTALALLPKVFTSAFVDVDGLAAALKAAEEGEKPKDWLGKLVVALQENQSWIRQFSIRKCLDYANKNGIKTHNALCEHLGLHHVKPKNFETEWKSVCRQFDDLAPAEKVKMADKMIAENPNLRVALDDALNGRPSLPPTWEQLTSQASFLLDAEPAESKLDRVRELASLAQELTPADQLTVLAEQFQAAILALPTAERAPTAERFRQFVVDISTAAQSSPEPPNEPNSTAKENFSLAVSEEKSAFRRKILAGQNELDEEDAVAGR